MKLKKLKKTHFALIASALLIVSTISFLMLFAEKTVELALARVGLDQTRVGEIDFGFDGTVLKKIELPRLGLQVAELRIYASAANLGRARASKVFVSGVTWQPPAAPENAADAPQRDIRAILAALDIYTDEIELQDFTLTPAPDQPSVTGKATLYDRGDRYQLHATFATPETLATTPQPAVSLAARLNAELFKGTGAAKAQLDIDTLDVEHPSGISAKRVSGWLNAELPQDPTQPPMLGAELTAGAVRIFDIPLIGATLTATGDLARVTAVLAARLPERDGRNAGNGLHAEITLTRPTDITANEIIAVLIDGDFSDLDALGSANVAGSARIKAALNAQKSATGAYGDTLSYSDISGTVSVTAKKLALGSAFSQASADIDGVLSFEPATRTVSFGNTDKPMTLKAKRDADNWDLAVNKLLLTYDTLGHTFKFDVDNASVKAPAFAVTDASAALTITGDKATNSVAEGKINGKVTATAKPAPFTPLTFTATLTPLSSRQHTTGISLKISGLDGALIVNGDGRHDAAAQKGDLRLRLTPIKMQQGVRSLDEFFPVTAKYAEDVTGEFGVRADVAWRKGKTGWVTTQTGGILLRDIAATVNGFPLAGVNTVIRFDQLSPPVFTRQQIAIGAFTAGLPLQNGVITASLDGGNKLIVHDGRMDMASGKITLAPFTLDIATRTADVVLSAEQLDLAQLFAIAPLEGLSAEGKMNGNLPIAMRGDEIKLVDGSLQSVAGGYIRYSPQKLPAFLADDTNQHIVDLRTALANFNFASLRMGLTGDLLKEQKITLNIEGKNPDFYGGHPVKLNLNVEGPLQNIVRYAPGSDNIPDAIQKQFEQFEDANATADP